MTERTETASFSLIFAGDGLGAIDVDDLAPALLGLADVVAGINEVATEGRASVRLRVRASFRPGSFNVDLELVRTVYDKFVELFSGRDLVALSTFFGLLGISCFGLIQLVRKSKGKAPRRVLEIKKTERVKLTFEDDDTLEVDRKLWRLFNLPRARQGLAKLTKPLRFGDIEALQIRYADRPPEAIVAPEAEFFASLPPRESELVTESEKVIRIVSLHFKAGNKWRVSEGGLSYLVTILDQCFADRVLQGAVRFGAGDRLRVLLRTRQWTEGGVLKSSYEVAEVRDVVIAPKDRELPFPGE